MLFLLPSVPFEEDHVAMSPSTAVREPLAVPVIHRTPAGPASAMVVGERTILAAICNIFPAYVRTATRI